MADPVLLAYVAVLFAVHIDWVAAGRGLVWPGGAPIDPMKALFWSAVINGVIAVPMMAVMMPVASRRQQMGRFAVAPATWILSWIATGVMGVAAMAMIALAALGKAS